MNRSPAGEETLVFIGYMRVSKADGSQVVDQRPDALAVTGVPADQLDLDRGSGKRDDWPGFPLQDDGTELRLAQAAMAKARPGLRETLYRLVTPTGELGSDDEKLRAGARDPTAQESAV
jgi:hypothetical protein